MQLQLIVILIIVLLIVMFAVQNAVGVSVVFFVWRVDASLAVVIAACFGLGAVSGALHLQAYLNEFVFLFNRRFYPMTHSTPC